MVIKVLLIISIVLQLIAALIAIRLMSMTKYNFSWILFTIALITMSVLRFGEYITLAGNRNLNVPPHFFVWLGILTSLCFAIGLFYVKKIFTHIERLNHQRKLTEKRILNAVLRTEETERMRFSKELHDGLGPLLSSAKLSLSVLKNQGRDDVEKEIIENTAKVIEEAVYSLREISNNLSPHILKDFGLSRGISNFINKIPSDKVKINYSSNIGSQRYDTDIEVILYRVVCELVNNSIKHSQGDKITITLNRLANILTIDYSDNGKGFNPAAMIDVGMGLSNITSRVSSIKGTVEITSRPNKGMRAVINVNLTDNNDKATI